MFWAELFSVGKWFLFKQPALNHHIAVYLQPDTLTIRSVFYFLPSLASNDSELETVSII